MKIELADAELVYKAVVQLRQLKRNMLVDYFSFGKILHDLGVKKGEEGERKNAPYRLYAPHIKNQGHFAKELGMSVSSLHNIVGVYLAFNDLFLNSSNGALDILPTRLVRLLPLNLQEEEKEEWLHRAADYDATSFQNAINERQGKITTDSCEHEDCEPWSKCKVCGAMTKV